MRLLPPLFKPNSSMAMISNPLAIGLILLFFATLMWFAKGYVVIPAVFALWGMGLIMCKKTRQSISWTAFDRRFIWGGVCYVAINAWLVFYHGDSLRELDTPSRAMLLLPWLLLFKHVSIHPHILLHAIPLGAGVAGIVAMYQRWVLHFVVPFPGIMSIQAGDMAITLGSLSLVATLHWWFGRRYVYAFFYGICALLGGIASLLSGARGGWISVPLVIVCLLWGYRHQLTQRIRQNIIVGFAVVIVLAVAIPQFGVQQRYLDAHRDIQHYFSLGEKNSSIGARFDMWANALRGTAEKPLFAGDTLVISN